MPLQNEHFRAIGMLAFGLPLADVARDSNCSVSTLHRWKKMPEFRAALDLELAKRQSAAPDQIQTIATESFEAQLDAQRELRSMRSAAKTWSIRASRR